ncbi:MAG: hypothetical protein FJ265_17550 [Planctomycetes bacterium]|nr:hypothetical protein [Planctomycetota bacterium]
MLCIRWKTVATAVLPVLATLAVATAQEEKPVTPTKPAEATKPVPAARLAAPPQGQKRSQEDLIKLRDEKLALEVFQKAPWTFDYDVAREEAKRSGKLIFTYFSRSCSH